MNLGDIMLSEINKLQKDKYYMIPDVLRIGKFIGQKVKW